MSLPKELRAELLTHLQDLGGGQSELEDENRLRQSFYPVPEHVRALDPFVVLVVGARGSGKSALFRAGQLGLAREVLSETRQLSLGVEALSQTAWRDGYPLADRFPDSRTMLEFLDRETDRQGAARDLWFASLTREVARALVEAPEIPSGLSIPSDDVQDLLEAPGADPSTLVSLVRANRVAYTLFLDKASAALNEAGRTILISYDELDTVSGTSLDRNGDAVSGLLSLWVEYSRRWRAIRPKLFLRSDLFRRHSGIYGADLVKLAANRADLTWSVRDLYAMLAKRILNGSELLREQFGSTVAFDEDPILGAVPRLTSAEDARPFVRALAGEYMGKGPKKGQTFNWIIDHIRDGQGVAVPRSLVRLVELSARHERADVGSAINHVIQPTSLRSAIDEVSKSHVLSAVTTELPWLTGVRQRLDGLMVPAERREVLKRLARRWNENWAEGGAHVPPPADDDRALLEYLVELGVLRPRGTRRVDTSDLYLAGLNLKRKGGVKQSSVPEIYPDDEDEEQLSLTVQISELGADAVDQSK